MNESIAYGGGWTSRKLEALRDYLRAYLDVFKNQRHWVTLYYIDAFAGPGLWRQKEREDATPSFFEDEDVKQYKDGSPMIALGMTDPGFDRFIFVEKDEGYLANLRQQAEKEHSEKIDDVQFERNDANTVVPFICDKWDKVRCRAVIFLDPFGMAVEWRTIEAIAKTESMDLWVLFPVGMGVNRMLTRDGKISPAWEKKLDALFGTKDWRQRFYRKPSQPTLFKDDNEERAIKDTSFEEIAQFFIERLEGVFSGVVKEPLILRNSRNNPMFALCFAVGNPKGAPIAVRIAKHIIGKEK